MVNVKRIASVLALGACFVASQGYAAGGATNFEPAELEPAGLDEAGIHGRAGQSLGALLGVLHPLHGIQLMKQGPHLRMHQAHL